MSWRPINTAPTDGQHILGIVLDGGVGFGWFGGKQIAKQAVIHWWGHPGEEGFYTSVNEWDPENPFPATHWRPLPMEPLLRPCGCVQGGSDFCEQCY